MTNKKYYTVGTVHVTQSSSPVIKWQTKNTTLSEQLHNNRKIVETDAKSIPLTHIHDRSLSLLGAGTWIKYCQVKLDLWDPYLGEAMRTTLNVMLDANSQKLKYCYHLEQTYNTYQHNLWDLSIISIHKYLLLKILKGAIVAMIVCYLDLQLPM